MNRFVPTFGNDDELRIDIRNEQEMLYWSTRLQVTPEKLRQAVFQVGARMKNVLGKIREMRGAPSPLP
jgi:hypothetical protein